MATLRITEIDGEREVRLDGAVFYDGAWHPDGVTFRSRYRVETLEALHAVKGDFLYDEILRVEDPGYLREQFIEFVKRLRELAGAEVLDFGSGCGSSSVLLAREGAQVTSVELMPGLRKAARLRVQDEGQAARIRIVDAESMTSLPFEKEAFDLITLNAVVEHMQPEDRRPILRHLWSLLRPGGLLVITETPNRVWPWDGHTTRLPLVSWLPLPLACRLARSLRPGEFGRKTEADLVYDGIIGSTWWALCRALPKGARPSPTEPVQEHRAYFARLRGRKHGASRAVVEALAAGLLPVSLALRMTGGRVPLSAFFPYLNVAFFKA